MHNSSVRCSAGEKIIRLCDSSDLNASPRQQDMTVHRRAVSRTGRNTMLLKIVIALVLIVSAASAALSASRQTGDLRLDAHDERGRYLDTKPLLLINRPSVRCTETGRRC
jgi:hypothetical protein